MYELSQTLRTAISAGNPQRVLIEFTQTPDGTPYNPVVTFSNEDISITSGLTLTSDFNSETDLTIGQCPSAQIRFSMLNDGGQLENFEFGRFRAYLGARIDTGTPAQTAKTKTFTDGLYEFAPLGTFDVQRPDIVRKKIIEVDANDLMTLFDKEMPSAEELGIDYEATQKPTIGTIFTRMCSHLQVTYKTNTFLNSDIKVSKEPKQFEGATMREVLGWIAEAACSNARFNRDGQLEFAWLTTVNKVYDEHNYSEFSAAWYETQAIDSLHIRNADSTTELVLGSGDNAYMIQDNPFLRQS